MPPSPSKPAPSRPSRSRPPPWATRAHGRSGCWRCGRAVRQNNTVNDMAAGRLMFRSEGHLYMVKAGDWILREAGGYVFALSDHLCAT